MRTKSRARKTDEDPAESLGTRCSQGGGRYRKTRQDSPDSGLGLGAVKLTGNM